MCVRWTRSCFLLWTTPSTPLIHFLRASSELFDCSSCSVLLQQSFFILPCSCLFAHPTQGQQRCLAAQAPWLRSQVNRETHTFDNSLLRLSLMSGTSGRKMRCVKTVDLFCQLLDWCLSHRISSPLHTYSVFARSYLSTQGTLGRLLAVSTSCAFTPPVYSACTHNQGQGGILWGLSAGNHCISL